MVVELKGGQRATDRPRKMFTQTFGKAGTGKTSLGLSHPSPLYIANLDKNMDDLLERLPSHYEIFYEEALPDVDMNRSTATQVMMKVKALFDAAVKRNEGTFFLDGADLYWDYVKEAKLPEDAELPNQWGPANSAMQSFYRRAEHSGLQVVFSVIASNVWTGATKESNRMKADGFKHAERFITNSIYMFTPEDHQTPQEKPAATTGQTHSGYISVSKLKESLVGSVVPNISYKMLYRMVFGELPPDHEKLWVPSS